MPAIYIRQRIVNALGIFQANSPGLQSQGRRLRPDILRQGGNLAASRYSTPDLPSTLPDQGLRTGVLEGCRVTAQITPNMTVSVAAGGIIYQNTPATVTATTVTIAAADATQDRVDAVVANPAGSVLVLQGAYADGLNAKPPILDGYVLLAYVSVFSQASSSYTGTITQAMIDGQLAGQDTTDVRAFELIHTSPYRVSGLWYGQIPAGGAVAGWTDQDMYLSPFFVGKTIMLQAIGVNLANPAATTGSKMRLGIYRDDGAGALSLLVDAGQVAADGGTSSPSLPITATLSPGFWWLACAFQSLGATKPTVTTLQLLSLISPIGGSTLSDTAAGRIGGLKFSGVSGALPASPSSPTYSPSPVPGVWVQAA